MTSISVSSDDSETQQRYAPEPAYWGPGVWFTVHSAAARVRTTQGFWSFVETFLPILTNLLCETCSDHVREYAHNHHPASYASRRDAQGRLIGAFAWTFDLHNEASRHAGNVPMPWSDALAIFSPILDLSDEQIAADRYAARSPTHVHTIASIDFFPDPPTDTGIRTEVEVETESPVRPSIVRRGPSVVTPAQPRVVRVSATPMPPSTPSATKKCAACQSVAKRAAQRTAQLAAQQSRHYQ